MYESMGAISRMNVQSMEWKEIVTRYMSNKWLTRSWGDGVVNKSICCATGRTCVQIPSTHLKSFTWPWIPVTPVLGSRGRGLWKLENKPTSNRDPGSMKDAILREQEENGNEKYPNVLCLLHTWVIYRTFITQY